MWQAILKNTKYIQNWWSNIHMCSIMQKDVLFQINLEDTSSELKKRKITRKPFLVNEKNATPICNVKFIYEKICIGILSHL